MRNEEEFSERRWIVKKEKDEREREADKCVKMKGINMTDL